eukprot:6999371-Pyramimonas_sp.AAC.1
MLELGWAPPQAHHDPVAWRKRDYNVVADFLANYTMDSRASWSKNFDYPFPGVHRSECNVVAHSDG